MNLPFLCLSLSFVIRESGSRNGRAPSFRSSVIPFRRESFPELRRLSRKRPRDHDRADILISVPLRLSSSSETRPGAAPREQEAGEKERETPRAHVDAHPGSERRAER